MRIIASILIILMLVIITPVFLLVTSLKTNVLNTTFLKNELERNDVYTLAFDLADEQINNIQIDPEFPVTNQEISTLVKQVITPDWLQQNVEGLLDSFNAWLNAPAGTELSQNVSLAEPKVTLANSLDAFLTDKLKTLEPCPRNNRSEEDQGICNLAGLNLDEAKKQLKENGVDPDIVTNLLPDTLDLLNPDLSKLTGEANTDNPEGVAVNTDEIQKNLEISKKYYQLGQRFFWYAWIIYAVLLALFIVMNATGGWRRVVRWTGVLLFFIGIIPAAIGFASVIIVNDLILPGIQFDPNFPTEVAELVPKMIQDAQSVVFTLPMAVGLALVGLGLAGIVGAHWISRPSKPSLKIKLGSIVK